MLASPSTKARAAGTASAPTARCGGVRQSLASWPPATLLLQTTCDVFGGTFQAWEDARDTKDAGHPRTYDAKHVSAGGQAGLKWAPRASEPAGQFLKCFLTLAAQAPDTPECLAARRLRMQT
jgi:hypothetical protein